MAHRGRRLANPARDVAMRSKKSSLSYSAEAREMVMPDLGPGTSPAIAELGRVLGVKDPEGSMLRLAEVLERSTSLLRNSPDFAIPEVRFSQIEDGRFSYYVTRQINRRGVVVVRGVVPTDTACRWQDDLMEYLEANGARAGPPGARDVFWSRAQSQAREHVGVRQALAALNRLWKPDPSTPVDLTKSLTFCDRAFVGKPACSRLGLTDLAGRGNQAAGPVMAGGPGAFQRWLCPHLSKAYRDIFEGRWEDWDPFKAGPRMKAAEMIIPSELKVPQQQPFRPFQGYISFGHWGEHGNVHVVPMMRVATAFTLLRPFMPDVLAATSEGDQGRGKGQGEWLCGAGNGRELVLSSKWHQPILDAFVRLPPLSPGDAVFWHPDIIHCEAGAMPDYFNDSGDDAAHLSASDANVATNGVNSRNRIGNGFRKGDGHVRGDTGAETFAGVHVSCLPICEANSAYVREQRSAFLEGSPPPIFAAAGGEERRLEAGFAGRASLEELTRGGRRAMGLWRYNKEHHNPALDAHHRLLHIPYEW